MPTIQIQREWNLRFGFLARLQFEAPFLLILALANSVKDLGRLHQLMRPNCRMLRREWRDLEAFWRDLWETLAPQRGERLSDEVVQEMLELAYRQHVRSGRCSPHGLTTYYKERLDEGREVGDTAFRECHSESFVFSTPGRLGYGSEHFLVKLFGQELLLGCTFAPSLPLELGVRIVIWEHDLTEPLTHQLLSLPESGIGHRMGSSNKGEEVDFWYTLPAEHFQILRRRQVVTAGKEKIWIPLPGFLPTLTKALKEKGLPIEDIRPIM